MKNLKYWLVLLAVVTLLIPGIGLAFEVPHDNSNGKYFYIFGPQGNPLDGAGETEVDFYIDVPETTAPVTIEVFDPNTGGALDEGILPWDTTTEFSVIGDSTLAKETFGSESTYDDKFYKFGPFNATQGKKVGDKYRFTLKVKTLTGDDLNMFFLRIEPESADVFSYYFLFELLPKAGDKINFYPEIPAGIEHVVVGNYDLDADGGASRLKNVLTGERYRITDSASGQWAETKIVLSPAQTTRMDYTVTTKSQTNGHAGLRLNDDKGNPIPIYFRKGAAPRPTPPAPAPKVEGPACNQFVFDATQSSDPNKQKISYLWDFGDGQTSTEPVITHLYQKGGTYDVKLTVKDTSGLECDTAVSNQTVRVNTPPKAMFSLPEIVCTGDTVSLDASATTDSDPGKLTYNWSFSDGTSADGVKVTKVFDKGGVYNVKLFVNDNEGSSCSTDGVQRTIKVNTPPVAQAGNDISICRKTGEPFTISLDGSGSSDADHNALKYVWDFGDGSTAEGAKVSHTYQNAGKYTAKLVVTDDSGAPCSSSMDSVAIDLNRSPKAVAGRDVFACTGSSVTFDGSASTGESGETLTYLWNFGDGSTGEGQTVKHTYQKGGKYTATLKVDNGKQSSCSTAMDAIRVHINSMPNAALKEVKSICAGNSVTLDASSSTDPDGDALKYSWDFGDGVTIDDGAKVNHTYEKGGNYTVTVSVDDGKGSGCSKSTASIDVKVNSRPKADAGPNLVCCEGKTTPFDGSKSSDPDGDQLAYRWDFGDGAAANEAKTQHAYAKHGIYNVRLFVDDGQGTQCSSDASGFTAEVNATPIPVIKIKQK